MKGNGDERMSDPTLTTVVRKVSPDVSVIDIIGSVTRSGEDALMEAYREASGERTRGIVLNFERLEYMNSSGIGLLVTMLVRANRQNQQLFAVGLNSHYQDIFALTRLNEAIHICADEPSALAAAGHR
jgi:anti-sigma B factor antagonist